ncbi:MAG: biotin/lipoyl-containing protein [Planctomycetota bacterium]
MRITVNGAAYDVEVEVLDDTPGIPAAGSPAIAPAAAPPPAAPARSAPAPSAAPKSAVGEVASPIAGNVLDVKVKAGDTVALNDTLLVLEAMKMESNVASPQAGVVAEVLVKSGDAVTQGQPLVRF